MLSATPSMFVPVIYPPQGVVSRPELVPLLGEGGDMTLVPAMHVDTPLVTVPRRLFLMALRSAGIAAVAGVGFRAYKQSGKARNAGLAVGAASFALAALGAAVREMLRPHGCAGGCPGAPPPPPPPGRYSY